MQMVNGGERDRLQVLYSKSSDHGSIESGTESHGHRAFQGLGNPGSAGDGSPTTRTGQGRQNAFDWTKSKLNERR